MNTNTTQLMTPAQKLQATLDAMTPTERDMIAKTPVQDWINTFDGLPKEPTFWQGIKNAALQGAIDALEDFNNDD